MQTHSAVTGVGRHWLRSGMIDPGGRDTARHS
jgi:hypothetical protein